VIIIDIYDQINISVYNIVIVDYFFSISIYDSLTVSEDISIENTQLGEINVSDSLTISEDISIEIFLSDINIADTLNLEFVSSVNHFFELNIFDQINIYENLGKANNLYINIFDSITISEYITMESFRFSPSVDSEVGSLAAQLRTPLGKGGYGMKTPSASSGMSL